jgi:hypothetical protein
LTAVHFIFADPGNDVRVFAAVKSRNLEVAKSRGNVLIAAMARLGYTVEFGVAIE